MPPRKQQPEGLQCPHCPEMRQSVESMDEHVTARHGDVRKLPGARTVIPGAAEVPDAVRETLEGLISTAVPRNFGEMREGFERMTEQVFNMSGGTQVLPEFIFMWDQKAVRHKVQTGRMLSLMMKKGFRLEPPTTDEYDRFWFHWRCPIPTCVDARTVCDRHGKPGSDSNHPLGSPELVMLDHLQTGGKIHKQYFEMHKDELAEKYREAFRTFMQSLEERAAKSEEIQREREAVTA